MMKFILIISLSLITSLYSTDMFKGVSLYPFGIVKHFEPTDQTHEGNMEYFAISKTLPSEEWRFEIGGGTFIDSYTMRSYKLFTNISHMDYTWGIVAPVLAFDCFSKGREHESNERKNFCTASLKIRVGAEDGLFMSIQPVPKIKGLTNGFIAVEFGYKF